MPRSRAGFFAHVALALVALFAAPEARAQNPPQPATLARILAEAADGYRTGTPLFFAANRVFPHRYAGPFETERQARQAAQDSGASWAAFGPYISARDSSTVEVVSVSVTIRRNGVTERFDVDPRQVDALFLTPAAVEKFMIPYYVAVYGAAWAERLDRIVGGRGGGGGACHRIGTLPCEMLPDLRPISVPWP